MRDVESVVRSLLNFERTTGFRLVKNEQQAYELWLRSIGACRQAEIAYGPEVVRRVRYSDLVKNPELSLRSLLNFLNEAFEPACVEPLQSRINSSNVPADFDASDARTAPAIIQEAKSLSVDLQRNPQPSEAVSERSGCDGSSLR